MEDYKDPETARRWSADPITHNPTRQEQLDILLAILQSEYRPGTTILDVGFGSGIVEEMIFQRIPGAQVVGVDGSQAMLDIANERLAAYKGQYEVVIHDLSEMSTMRLPERDYRLAISVQTIHNVADSFKKETFQAIYKALSAGGLFLMMDRIAIDTPGLFDLYQAVWKRLARAHNSNIDHHEGANPQEHQAILDRRGDQPITLEQHLDWLREVGFEVACLHLHGNRALFAARKA